MKLIIPATPLLLFTSLAQAATTAAPKAAGSDLLGIGLLFVGLIAGVAGVFWYMVKTDPARKKPDESKNP